MVFGQPFFVSVVCSGRAQDLEELNVNMTKGRASRGIIYSRQRRRDRTISKHNVIRGEIFEQIARLSQGWMRLATAVDQCVARFVVGGERAAN